MKTLKQKIIPAISFQIINILIGKKYEKELFSKLKCHKIISIHSSTHISNTQASN